jgi:hypothetical protein
MNHVSLPTFSNKSIPHIEPGLDLTMLPADVMPNIFNRLSATDFLRLVYTTKKVYFLAQPYLRDLATRKLDAFEPESLDASIRRLAPLFRTGCLHISGEAWLDLLKKAGNAGIDRELIETLVFSFAPDDTKLPTLPILQETAPVAYPFMYPWDTDHLALNRESAMRTICENGLAEMIGVEMQNTDCAATTRQLSLRPGWKGLVKIFGQLDICDQIKSLASIRVGPSSGENILLAFKKLSAPHLAALVAADNFIFSPDDFREEEIDCYYNALANVCTLPPAPGKDSFLLSLCKKNSFSWFPGFLPWRENWRGPCNLMFRLLAIEARKDKPADIEAWSNSVKDKALISFITQKELNHFVKKLNNRMDHGMRLELAVSEWIDENREPGKCVIS